MDKKAFVNLLNTNLSRLTETDSAVTPQKNVNEDETLVLEDSVENAIEAYANAAVNEEVLLLIDDTVFGSGKKGLLMTNTAIYFCTSTKDYFNIKYSDIGRVEAMDDDEIIYCDDDDDGQLHVFDKNDKEIYVYEGIDVKTVPLKEIIDAALEYLV